MSRPRLDGGQNKAERLFKFLESFFTFSLHICIRPILNCKTETKFLMQEGLIPPHIFSLKILSIDNNKMVKRRHYLRKLHKYKKSELIRR